MRLISKGKAIGLHEHDGLILSRSRCKPRDTKLRFSVDGGGLVACFDSETPTQIRPLGTELEVNGIAARARRYGMGAEGGRQGWRLSRIGALLQER